MYRSKHRELVFAALLLALATALALAPDAYVPMLARAFLLQWSAGLAAIGVLAVLRKRWWIASSAVMGTAMVFVQVRPPAVEVVRVGEGPALRVLHMNVLQPNELHADAVERTLGSGADLVSVQEVGPEWALDLADGLRSAYPYQHIEPRTNCSGIALFSRIPFDEVRTVTMEGAPFIEAVLTLGARPVRVLSVHTASPISYGHFQRRNAQLELVAGRVAALDTPTVVVGDLNTVHWDRAFGRFCARSGLLSTAGTEQRTWPSVGPLALIPLDHLLVSAGVAPVSIRTFEVPGSDHRGLLAELRITGHAR